MKSKTTKSAMSPTFCRYVGGDLSHNHCVFCRGVGGGVCLNCGVFCREAGYDLSRNCGAFCNNNNNYPMIVIELQEICNYIHN